MSDQTSDQATAPTPETAADHATRPAVVVPPTAVREALQPVVAPVLQDAVQGAVKEAAGTYLDAVQRIGRFTPAAILVTTLLFAVAVGVWLKIRQDSETAAAASRDRADAREDARRAEDARDRDRERDRDLTARQLIQANDTANKALDAQREATRVLLMVKGAIDDFRSEAKRSQEMLRDHNEESKRQRALLEKILECLKGRWPAEPARPDGPL